MVERAYKLLSISRQCELLGISRSAYYYTPQTLQNEEYFELLKKIREVQIKHPEKGYRRIYRDLKASGEDVMRRFGVIAVYPGMNLSRAGKKSRKYPYLLKGKVIRYPNQV